MNLVALVLCVLVQNIVLVEGRKAQECFVDVNRSPILMRSNSIEFCSNAEHHLLTGDFDGNRVFKILCHDDNTGKMSIFDVRTGQVLNIAQRFCVGAQLIAADVNGDQTFDLVCHSKNETIKYLLNSKHGKFENATVQSFGYEFCSGDNDTLHLRDLNNDTHADAICHEKEEGQISYAYSEDNGFGTIATAEKQWCAKHQGEFKIGDFNGDGRADVFCHSHKAGQGKLIVSTEAEVFGVQVWSNKMPKKCNAADSFLLIADVNADKRDDLICRDTNNGDTTIIRNKQPEFFPDDTFDEFKFCSHSGERNFFTGDLDGDGTADLICQTSQGIRQIRMSRCFF